MNEPLDSSQHGTGPNSKLDVRPGPDPRLLELREDSSGINGVFLLLNPVLRNCKGVPALRDSQKPTVLEYALDKLNAWGGDIDQAIISELQNRPSVDEEIVKRKNLSAYESQDKLLEFHARLTEIAAKLIEDGRINPNLDLIGLLQFRGVPGLPSKHSWSIMDALYGKNEKVGGEQPPLLVDFISRRLKETGHDVKEVKVTEQETPAGKVTIITAPLIYTHHSESVTLVVKSEELLSASPHLVACVVHFAPETISEIKPMREVDYRFWVVNDHAHILKPGDTGSTSGEMIKRVNRGLSPQVAAFFDESGVNYDNLKNTTEGVRNLVVSAVRKNAGRRLQGQPDLLKEVNALLDKIDPKFEKK